MNIDLSPLIDALNRLDATIQRANDLIAASVNSEPEAIAILETKPQVKAEITKPIKTEKKEAPRPQIQTPPTAKVTAESARAKLREVRDKLSPESALAILAESPFNVPAFSQLPPELYLQFYKRCDEVLADEYL